MKKKIVLTLVVSLVLALVVPTAHASLVPMSWGFPQIVQSNSLTAFQKDSAVATDNEASSIAFPTTASDLCGTAFGSAFPTITQTAVQNQLLNSVKFQQENSNFAFAYPFISIGGSPLAAIPAMGFF